MKIERKTLEEVRGAKSAEELKTKSLAALKSFSDRFHTTYDSFYIIETPDFLPSCRSMMMSWSRSQEVSRFTNALNFLLANKPRIKGSAKYGFAKAAEPARICFDAA